MNATLIVNLIALILQAAEEDIPVIKGLIGELKSASAAKQSAAVLIFTK
jgi:hypothetical protein